MLTYKHQYEIIKKKVSENEFIFTSIASEANISEKLIEWYRCDDGSYTIYLEKYPNFLFDEPIWDIYKYDAIKLINQLHALGIYHGSIGEDYFVVDPTTKEIRLTGYNRSSWIVDLPKKEAIKVEKLFSISKTNTHICYEMRNNHHPTLFEKIVSEKEFLFTSIASNANIGVKLVDWYKYDNDNIYTIYLEKYPCSLSNEQDWSIYKNDAIVLINKLHNLGIYHNDIKADNFVVDPKTKEIKLIDYGESCWISDLPKLELEEVEELFNH